MAGLAGTVVEGRFRGAAAMTLTAGELTATFLPELGLTGVSLTYRGREHFALRGGGPPWLRAGRTLGLPLLAPWANRLASWQYRAAGVDVDLTGIPLHTDTNGLPSHGLLLGRPGWRIETRSTGPGRAGFRAAIDVDAAAFPFPHRIEVGVTAHDGDLVVDTRVVPTGRRPVPVAFGWHPFLRLPEEPRRRWRLHLPARTHIALGDDGLPTGESWTESSEAERIGTRTFDDLYLLGRKRELAVEADDGTRLAMRPGAGYRYGQVWVPAGRRFVALEPMTVETNSLVAGTTPLVAPGDAYDARFTIALQGPG